MASNPLNSNLAAPLPPPGTQPSMRGAERGKYLSSDEAARASQGLSRGADRASMYLPSDERRAVQSPPTGAAAAAERSMSALPYDEGRALLPRGSEQQGLLLPSRDSRAPLLSARGPDQLGLRLPSDYHHHHEGGMPLLSRGGERGGIFLTTDDHALARQVEQYHYPDASNINIRPLFHLVQEIIERATQTVVDASLVTILFLILNLLILHRFKSYSNFCFALCRVMLSQREKPWKGKFLLTVFRNFLNCLSLLKGYLVR